MFFSVLLILATIWTSSDGALSCKTDDDLECIFPFKSSTSSSEYNQCKAASKGRTWCATAIKANLVYSAWGYCNLDTCKEVQSAQEAAQKIEAQGPCYACIERVAYGPPPHWQSLECVEPCVSEGVAVEPACFNCLVRTATRQCLEPCGAQRVLDSHAFPAVGSETCTKITPFTAIQSSTYGPPTNKFSPNSVATNAIDGNAATTASTLNTEAFPWIAVQLTEDMSLIPVTRVIINNRVDADGQRLKNLNVYVSNHPPASADSSFSNDKDVTKIGTFEGPGVTGQIIEIPSHFGATGSFVVLQMQNVKEFMSFGEIITFSN